MSKGLREKIINNKYKSKEEIAIAKSELRSNLTKINNDIIKARTRKAQIVSEMKKESSLVKLEDQKKHDAYFENLKEQKKLIVEHKLLIKEQKNILRKSLIFEKQKIKNILISSKIENKRRKNLLKEESRQLKLEQKQKLIDVNKEISEKKLSLIKEVKMGKVKNKIVAKKANQLIADEKIELNKKTKELAKTKNENRIKLKTDKMNRISKTKAESLEIQRKKIQENEAYRRKVIELKNRRLEIKINKNDEVLELKDDLNKQILENEVLVNKKSESINIDKSEKFLKEISMTEKDSEGKRETQQTIDIKETIVNNGFAFNYKTHNFLKYNLPISKRTMKKFKYLNKDNSKVNIEKTKLPSSNKKNVLAMSELKESGGMTSLLEYIEYQCFVSDKEFDKNLYTTKIISATAHLLEGKILSFLGGYFYKVKIKGFNYIEYSESLPWTNKLVVELPESDLLNVLEEMIYKKLDTGHIIQISNNIAIKKTDTILPLVDEGFLK